MVPSYNDFLSMGQGLEPFDCIAKLFKTTGLSQVTCVD